MKPSTRYEGTFAWRLDHFRRSIGNVSLEILSRVLGQGFGPSTLNRIMAPAGSKLEGGGRYYEDVLDASGRAAMHDKLLRRLPPHIATWICTGEGDAPRLV